VFLRGQITDTREKKPDYHCRMQPPCITRRRRPFLAPLWVSLLAVLVVAGIAWGYYRGATTTVVLLVRPLEKEPGAIDDPPLSPEGEQRAQRLAHMFGGLAAQGHIDAVYESDSRQAQQTGAPLLEQLHRAPVVFGSAEARSIAERAVREHAGGTILMIVTGAVLPEVVGQLAGADLPAADDPDLVYVVSVPTIGQAHLVRLRF
jgi:hypothetical protein